MKTFWLYRSGICVVSWLLFKSRQLTIVQMIKKLGVGASDEKIYILFEVAKVRIIELKNNINIKHLEEGEV